jgi:hypothetical protein
MPRSVIPDLMVLRLGTLTDSASEYHKVEQAFGPLLRKRRHDTREPGTPVSLRWALNPVLGFPRVPFEVWRRTRKEEPTDPILGAATFTAGSTVTLPNAVIEIRFEALPGAGGLTVEALGSTNRVLPGQRLRFTTAQGGRFRAAGIAALRLTGAGSITGIGAIVQSAWANLPDWQRIEVVGFPFSSGQLPSASYDPAQQGWEVPALDGPDAALVRLGVAALLQREPPPPGGSLSTPTWGFPDPKLFLQVLLKTVLPQVADCLATSDDLDPAALQALHRSTHSLDGLRQPGQPPPADPVQLALTTSRFISLAVQDGPVALGLGFGTIDIPQQGRISLKPDLTPSGTELGRDEYMLTAPFVTPFGKLDLAAIGHRVPSPPAFAGVQAVKTFDNRATVRDGAESVTVHLSWAAPLEQVGAAVIVDPPGTPSVLHNTPRPVSSGSFQPYLTEHRVAPDGNPPGDLRPGVTMPGELVPVVGSAVTTYAAAPLDVHGRWGPWQLTSHTTAARDAQKPGIGEVSIQLPSVLPAAGPLAPGCTLTVEVSWDWADRSAQRIEVGGSFCPVGPAPASVSGFGVSSTAVSLPTPVTIAFSLTGTPSIAPPPTGAPVDVVVLLQSATVVEITEQGVAGGPPPAGSAGSHVRRYRLKVPILSVSFAAMAEVGYAVSARAAERVRPGQLSAPTTPVATRVANPFPAPPPVLPPVTVLWTALPDASNRARTVLTWPAVPGASGYTVWEATETALSHAVGGTAQTGAIRTRAADLKARVAASVNASFGAFSRLNERPLTATSIELVLPGAADTLFAYRMSSITTQNVESARTADVVLVAVPHLETPGTPRLEARASSADERVTLTVVPGSGLPPDRIAIHRCRRDSLSDQIGTMGPPIVSVATAGLPSVTVPSLSGPAETGWQFEDVVAAGWTPYFYRCVSFGRHLPDDGIHAGMSAPSGLVMVVVPPAVPPLLATATKTSGAAGALFTFTTDLPFNASPAGEGTITIAAIAAATRTVLATLSSTAIVVTTPPPVSGATPPNVVASRTATVDRESTVSVLIPAALVPANAVSFVVTATDPLGRSKSLEVV